MSTGKLLRLSGAMIALGLISTLLAPAARAAVYTWNNQAADWNTASNWGGAVPGSGDVGLFNLNGAYGPMPTLTWAAPKRTTSSAVWASPPRATPR